VRAAPFTARPGGSRRRLRHVLLAVVAALAVTAAVPARAQTAPGPGTPPAGGAQHQPAPATDQAPAEQPAGDTAPAPASPRLTVWTPYQGAALAWLKDEAAAYGRSFGKQVEVTSLKLGEIKQRTMQGADKGLAADLFVGVPHDQFSALADAGLLADMGNYATGRYLADLNAQAARAFRYDGTLYGLPLSAQGPALIVNTDLVQTPPGSYAELKTEAASLTGGGRYGFGVDAANFYYAFGWLRTFGGYVFGTGAGGGIDTADIGLASEGAVAGLRELKALRYQDGLLPDDGGYDSVRQRFLAGKLAMLYDGPWAIPAIARAGIPVMVTPMPPLADGTPWRGLMNVDGVLVNHYSPDPVGAANLAKWLTQAGAQAALAQRAGSIPVSTQALDRVKGDAVIHGFGEALEHAVAIPNVSAMGAVWGPMDDALSSILASPDSDVKAILERAAAAVGGP